MFCRVGKTRLRLSLSSQKQVNSMAYISWVKSMHCNGLALQLSSTSGEWVAFVGIATGPALIIQPLLFRRSTNKLYNVLHTQKESGVHHILESLETSFAMISKFRIFHGSTKYGLPFWTTKHASYQVIVKIDID